MSEIGLSELRHMKNQHSSEIEENSLVDIRQIKINRNLPVVDRVKDFIVQIKNPYCFKVDGTVVKLKFSEEGISCQEAFYNMVNAIR